MKKIIVFATLLFLFGVISNVSADGVAGMEWPPKQETLDTLKMKLDVIKSLPDSVVRANTRMFVDHPEIDEANIYITDKFYNGIQVSTRVSETGTEWGITKPFVQLVLMDVEGNVVKEFSTGNFGSYVSDLASFALPEGVYRLKVNYGKKHTANGTKPKKLIRMNVYLRMKYPMPAKA